MKELTYAHWLYFEGYHIIVETKEGKLLGVKEGTRTYSKHVWYNTWCNLHGHNDDELPNSNHVRNYLFENVDTWGEPDCNYVRLCLVDDTNDISHQYIDYNDSSGNFITKQEWLEYKGLDKLEPTYYMARCSHFNIGLPVAAVAPPQPSEYSTPTVNVELVTVNHKGDDYIVIRRVRDNLTTLVHNNGEEYKPASKHDVQVFKTLYELNNASIPKQNEYDLVLALVEKGLITGQ